MVCVVLVTIKHVSSGNDWWYAACVCNKGVAVDSRRLFYPKCDKHIWTIVPRFRVKLRVIDETDSATFVLFDRDCYFLTKMTCSGLIAEMDREEEPTIVAKVIGGFVDRTFLFKIDVKNDVTSRYEQSFRVKKVCDDKDIISKFKSVAKVDNTLFQKSVDVEDDLTAVVVQSDMPAGDIQDLNSVVKKNSGVEEVAIGSNVHNELVIGVAWDLSSKFENDGAEDICEDNHSVPEHNEVDHADCNSVKRGI
ncbi:uncharacterized protein LOC131655374 [Vicia villosa]|uniref:uncharacterized protein LOC131655374 n=1 Tax=Vicia villosa TaxID=3911 RepID=UPI00273B9445|nr:uncharacterized protein LOC131655374 [Vicia villosa]